MSIVSGYVRHFEICNRHDLSHFTPFFITNKHVGYIAHESADALLDSVAGFERSSEGICLSKTLQNFEQRSATFAEATQYLTSRAGKTPRLEYYPVVEQWGDDPIAQIDRSAVAFFGLRAWGTHVNGWVRKKNEIFLWIGERAADRPADPGKLDNMIGGGNPIGLSLEENLCKEAQEEAGMDAVIARQARYVSTINYRLERREGLRRDTLFVSDIELPEDFAPHNVDGEVAAFHLMSLHEVAALVRDTDAFKFNCNLVIIDFLLRFGFIERTHPEYDKLQEWLKFHP